MKHERQLEQREVPRVKDKQIDAATDAEALVSLLIDAGERLPPRLRERILSFGPEVVPPLIALAQDEELIDVDGPGEGWAPIHAVDLLGELRASEAVEPMLRLLVETDWETIIHDRLLMALPKLGPAVLEPALAAHAATTDPNLRGDIASVLSKLEVRDERIYAILVEELRRDPMSAGLLADYGDSRALPLLHEALNQYEPKEERAFANVDLGELLDAIERLGGEVTPEQQARADQLLKQTAPTRERVASLVQHAMGQMDLASSPVRGARALAPEGRPAPPARKVGRNDPCPCGSGKKFKKCCLGKA